MNAKTCKQLRKSARLLAAQTDTAANASALYIENEKNRKIMLNQENKPFFASAGTMVCNPASERGIYRALKTNFKKNVSV